MSNGQFTDLAILAGLIERPLRVEEAAEALDISPQDVLARAHEGVEQGVLASEGSGYVLTGAAPEVDPASPPGRRGTVDRPPEQPR